MIENNQYAAFLADFAAGRLSEGERLAARLHFALSDYGAENACMLDVIGGAALERLQAAAVAHAGHPVESGGEVETHEPAGSDWIAHYASADLLAMKWRRNLFGVRTRSTHVPTATLLRMEPGEHAPRHSHGASDVTVVLQGAFADDWGEYHRGDLAFADAGDRHAPATIGNETCVCLVATSKGRPDVDLMAWLAGQWRRGGAS